MTDTNIKRLQDIQDTFLTPKGMLELDGQMHLIIKQKKLRLIGKVMAKQDNNLCKGALINGVAECNGEDLFN